MNKLDDWIFSNSDDIGAYSKEEKERLYRLFKINMVLWIPIIALLVAFTATRSSLILVCLIVFMLINLVIYIKTTHIRIVKRKVNEKKG